MAKKLVKRTPLGLNIKLSSDTIQKLSDSEIFSVVKESEHGLPIEEVGLLNAPSSDELSVGNTGASNRTNVVGSTNNTLSNVKPVAADKSDLETEDKINSIPENNTEVSEGQNDITNEYSETKSVDSIPSEQSNIDETTKLNNLNDGLTSEPKPPNEYSEYIHYEGDLAIYTDPQNGSQYVWCLTSNSWVLKPVSESSAETEQSQYGFENDKHTYTDTDGAKYIWDSKKNAWFPNVDDDFLAHYQMSYGFIDNASKPDDDKPKEIEKEISTEDAATALKRKTPQAPEWFDVDDNHNTKVYVSNLPCDVTEEEFIDVMQKCGLIMRELKTQKMKVKLYKDKESNLFKGDALCCYIKIESVDLALNIIDGSELRGHKVKVERAQFQMKGTYDPSLKPKKKKKDKEKIKRNQEKLFDWRPEKLRGEPSKQERVVIIKNLFEPSLFNDHVDLILEYQDDLREECSKLGEVTKVSLYDRHPEGVAQINMKEGEDALKVVSLLNGRWFGKRQLTAEIWDGRTKYRIAETESELQQRVDGWDKFLEVDKSIPQVVVENKETKIDEDKEIKID